MQFDYFVPTKILFGKGQLSNLHSQKLPGKKALIVISSGKSTRSNGYKSQMQGQQGEGDQHYRSGGAPRWGSGVERLRPQPEN